MLAAAAAAAAAIAPLLTPITIREGGRGEKERKTTQEKRRAFSLPTLNTNKLLRFQTEFPIFPWLHWNERLLTEFSEKNLLA